MPPKRKRSETTTAEAAPRATRTSARLSRTSSKASSGSAVTAIDSAGQAVKMTDDGGVDVEPAAKRKRGKATKTRAVKGTKGRGLSQQTESGTNETASTSGSVAGHAKKNAAKPEQYSEARARELFKTYEDRDTPGEIGPEGFERLCTDLDISLEGALPLVLAWQMHATEMAKFKESEWTQGTNELRVSNLQTLSLVLRNLEDLLLLDKTPLQPSAAGTVKKKTAVPLARDTSEPYDRQKYFRYASDKDKAFSELYAFCFALAKPPTARNIDMDTASAFWSVLVAPRFPIMKDILEFINEKGTYKGVNKDLWNMVLEFSRTIQPDLSNYEADGAWPTMLDDFVAWKMPNVTEVNIEV